MPSIDYKKANMNTLKKMSKLMNETGLLPENIDMRVGVTKQTLADAFVKGIETCNDIKRLDDVPEQVYEYYTSIVVATAPEGGENTGTTDGNDTPAGAGKATGRGAAKAPTAAEKKAAAAQTKKDNAAKKKAAATAEKAAKVPRITRAACMAGIVNDGTARTKKEMVEEMQKQYPGSSNDAPFWINAYCSLLIALGTMVDAGDGKFNYTGS